MEKFYLYVDRFQKQECQCWQSKEFCSIWLKRGIVTEAIQASLFVTKHFMTMITSIQQSLQEMTQRYQERYRCYNKLN
jgi:hypothetical protein